MGVNTFEHKYFIKYSADSVSLLTNQHETLFFNEGLREVSFMVWLMKKLNDHLLKIVSVQCTKHFLFRLQTLQLISCCLTLQINH